MLFLFISCSKFHSDVLFTSLSYILAIPFWISISYVCLSLHSNARLCYSNFSFVSLRLILSNMIDFALIKIRFNVSMCSLLSTYLLVFLGEVFIHFSVNNRIILFPSVKFISWCGIIPAVLSRYTFNVLRNQSLPGPCIHLMNVQGRVWDIWVWTYPSGSLHIFPCACQSSHSSWSKYFTRQLLLSLAWCNQHCCHIPL